MQSEIKNMTKKYAAEIEIKDNILVELQSLLAKAVEKKDENDEMQEYNIYLEANATLQELRTKADNIRPIINRLKKSTPRTDINIPIEIQKTDLDGNSSIYLLKRRGKEFYFARIIAWGYNKSSSSKCYLNPNGEIEYLSYTITTEKFENGKWVRNRTNEKISYGHLITKAVDHQGLPLIKNGFESILNTLENKNVANRASLPPFIVQPVTLSPFNSGLFQMPLEEYFGKHNIKRKSEKDKLARYILHQVKHFNREKKVIAEYFREMQKFVDKYKKDKRTAQMIIN